MRHTSGRIIPCEWADLFRVDRLLVIRDTFFWLSAVISCASVNERIHSSSSNHFVVGSFFFFKNMSCVLRRDRHSSGKSPICPLNCEEIESPSTVASSARLPRRR